MEVQQLTEIQLRAIFEGMHKNRNLRRHPCSGTYSSPPIAALWNQHLKTYNWIMHRDVEVQRCLDEQEIKDYAHNCPFCKAKPGLRTTVDKNPDLRELAYIYMLRCDNRECLVNPATKVWLSKEKCLTAWNRIG